MESTSLRWFLLVCAMLMVATADVTDCERDLKQLNNTAQILARQLMLQQWYTEEKTRSEGCSGIKQVRHQRDGTRSWYTETHTGSGVGSIHDHADSIRTMGMGEYQIVLNGVDFRTRHNDYLLQMPHSRSRQYKATEDLPFPDVPPSVLQQSTVEGQIKEMREYFRAFKLQDRTIRDYEPYFKPIISYLEGAWTYVGEEFEEPFPGERHWVNAKTWQELEDKVRFTAYAGTKNAKENLAYLPRAVVDVNETGLVLAQWNYRIACHPLQQYLSPDRIRIVDDLASRMVTGKTLEEMADSREARFTLAPVDSSEWSHGRYTGTLLDDIMEQIPGQDNYGAYHNDEAFGMPAYDPHTDQRLNSGYYHHLFKYDTKDGMGIQVRHRGYSDETLFMAMTSQEKVAGMNFNNCMHEWENRIDCDKFQQKWTYAIPLEIVYLTPLPNWNPYGINYYGWSAEPGADRVTANGRDGSEDKPFDGSNSIRFYRTPAEFFTTSEYTVRPADTTGNHVYVLDSNGVRRKVRASGHRTFIPEVYEGLGNIRQRYPIMPVHGEGGSVWKELDALKDIVLQPDKFKNMFYKSDPDDDTDSSLECHLPPSLPNYGSHIHLFQLTKTDRELLMAGGVVTKTTTISNGHQHYVSIVAAKFLNRGYQLTIIACGDQDTCWDGHDTHLSEGFNLDWVFVADIGKLEEPVVTTSPPIKSHSFQMIPSLSCILFVILFIYI